MFNTSPVAKPIIPIVNPEIFTIAWFFIDMHSHRLLEIVELSWHRKHFGQLFLLAN